MGCLWTSSNTSLVRRRCLEDVTPSDKGQQRLPNKGQTLLRIGHGRVRSTFWHFSLFECRQFRSIWDPPTRVKHGPEHAQRGSDNTLAMARATAGAQLHPDMAGLRTMLRQFVSMALRIIDMARELIAKHPLNNMPNSPVLPWPLVSELAASPTPTKSTQITSVWSPQPVACWSPWRRRDAWRRHNHGFSKTPVKHWSPQCRRVERVHGVATDISLRADNGQVRPNSLRRRPQICRNRHQLVRNRPTSSAIESAPTMVEIAQNWPMSGRVRRQLWTRPPAKHCAARSRLKFGPIQLSVGLGSASRREHAELVVREVCHKPQPSCRLQSP